MVCWVEGKGRRDLHGERERERETQVSTVHCNYAHIQPKLSGREGEQNEDLIKRLANKHKTKSDEMKNDGWAFNSLLLSCCVYITMSTLCCDRNCLPRYVQIRIYLYIYCVFNKRDVVQRKDT